MPARHAQSLDNQHLMASDRAGRKVRGGELEKISAMIEAGKIRKKIEKVFPLEQIAEAHRLSEAGHVRGKLVISIQQSAVSTQP